MTPRPRILPAVAAAWGFLAVALGAFGAHAIKDPWAKTLLQDGAQFGLLNALAVFAALFMETQGARFSRLSAWLFLAGGLIFSGSLYLMGLTGIKVLGAITPLGGVAMMAAWITLAVGAMSRPKA